MRHAALHIALVAALTLVAADRGAATMVTRLPLDRVTQKADRVVHATVAEVRSGRDEHGLPATWITLDVRRAFKGGPRRAFTMKQYGTAAPLPDGTVTRVSGLPKFVAGDEVVLFLRPDSGLGFTSPVGLGQGTYRVRQAGGRRRVRAAEPGAPSRDLDDFLGEVERLTGGGR
jgi:hypothetical protein